MATALPCVGVNPTLLYPRYNRTYGQKGKDGQVVIIPVNGVYTLNVDLDLAGRTVVTDSITNTIRVGYLVSTVATTINNLFDVSTASSTILTTGTPSYTQVGTITQTVGRLAFSLSFPAAAEPDDNSVVTLTFVDNLGFTQKITIALVGNQDPCLPDTYTATPLNRSFRAWVCSFTPCGATAEGAGILVDGKIIGSFDIDGKLIIVDNDYFDVIGFLQFYALNTETSCDCSTQDLVTVYFPRGISLATKVDFTNATNTSVVPLNPGIVTKTYTWSFAAVTAGSGGTIAVTSLKLGSQVPLVEFYATGSTSAASLAALATALNLLGIGTFTVNSTNLIITSSTIFGNIKGTATSSGAFDITPTIS